MGFSPESRDRILLQYLTSQILPPCVSGLASQSPWQTRRERWFGKFQLWAVVHFAKQSNLRIVQPSGPALYPL